MRVLAAVITFNRLSLLQRCLNSLNGQTYKVDDILVVDNSSTDNTNIFLKKNKINFITQINNGSASGWHTCIDYFAKNNFDYLWLMDDDGYPDKNALNNLINGFKRFNKASCISSTVVDEKAINNFVFPYPVLNKYKEPIFLSIKRKLYNFDDLKKKINNEIYYPYVQLFNGALISKKAISQIGNINKNYFIFGEEVDFFWRLRKKGVVLSLLDAIHYHPNVSYRQYTDEKIYYYLKNSIINNYKYFKYPFLRSICSILILVIRVSKRNSINDLFGYILGKKNFYFYKGIIRGFNKKLEIDHNEFN